MRQMGAEFAKKYPAVAGRLQLEPDRCADPHVERLLEAFSFLAARIHLRLDDDFPELTEGFLDVVYPHFLRPMPAMTVAEFSSDETGSNKGNSVTVPAGVQLTAKRTTDGVPCKFRTGYPVTLWPIEVKECAWRRPEQIPSPPRVGDAAAVLRVVLKARREVLFSKLEMDTLAFYLAGERGVALPLYELLSHNLRRIVVRSPERPTGKTVSLDRSGLRAMGFAADESLLPYPQRSFHGYRLLQEYFSFHEKFLFFQLCNLRPAIEAVDAGEDLEILFYVSQFEQPERMQMLEVGVSSETIRLGCTPIINLFSHAAEPVLLSQARHQYPVSVSARSRTGIEIFSIDSILATNPSRRTSVTLPPLFEHRFRAIPARAPVYWRSTRKYSEIDNRRPSDVYVSIVDAEGAMTEPNAEVLTVQCTCTNHDLPARLPFGDPDGDFYWEGGAGIGKIRALHRPTPTYPSPSGAGQTWSLISQLSLNHLSLGEAGLAAFQEILKLHNFTAATHFEKQIAGIVSMTTKKHIALMQTEFGSTAARGTRVEIELDESHFPGGGAYLFSAILDRFFGLYVSMNSFSQLAVRTNMRKEALEEWSPRAGSQSLI
ncbi:Protein ImpG/VasA [Acidisarcina polymorpha]|uniref:Protein ImpG/VasA n=2 Tax=Acidisarcina polymorpha TaxID=2211140 RepID=A0A2Z5G2L4_9BACT|nr:Protein ImpG/VasA [Acidisarcina polymorpha]